MRIKLGVIITIAITFNYLSVVAIYLKHDPFMGIIEQNTYGLVVQDDYTKYRLNSLENSSAIDELYSDVSLPTTDLFGYTFCQPIDLSGPFVLDKFKDLQTAADLSMHKEPIASSSDTMDIDRNNASSDIIDTQDDDFIIQDSYPTPQPDDDCILQNADLESQPILFHADASIRLVTQRRRKKRATGSHSSIDPNRIVIFRSMLSDEIKQLKTRSEEINKSDTYRHSALDFTQRILHAQQLCFTKSLRYVKPIGPKWDAPIYRNQQPIDISAIRNCTSIYKRAIDFSVMLNFLGYASLHIAVLHNFLSLSVGSVRAFDYCNQFLRYACMDKIVTKEETINSRNSLVKRHETQLWLHALKYQQITPPLVEFSTKTKDYYVQSYATKNYAPTRAFLKQIGKVKEDYIQNIQTLIKMSVEFYAPAFAKFETTIE